MEEEQKRIKETGGLEPQIILADNYDSVEEEMVEDSMSAEMLTDAIFKRKPYTCPTYRLGG